MPSGWDSKILTITNGTGMNRINDASPGMSVSSGTGQIKFDTLGGRIILGPDEVLYDTSIGTLYGGIYQYIGQRLTDATAGAIGLLCFWDPTVTEDLYQVSTLETIGGTAGGLTANYFAGCFLNTLTLGNYGFIQIAGKATVKFRSVLTGTAAIGSSVYAAGAGAGADNATADTLATAAAPTFAQVAQMQQRYIGQAEAIPVAGAASIIQMVLNRVRI